jgi:hypothetical protein
VRPRLTRRYPSGQNSMGLFVHFHGQDRLSLSVDGGSSLGPWLAKVFAEQRLPAVGM